MKFRAAIFGGSGYGGSELLRILLFHPNVEIVLVTANEQERGGVGGEKRVLLGLTGHSFPPAPSTRAEWDGLDIATLATPLAHAIALVSTLLSYLAAIDLTAPSCIEYPPMFTTY